MNKEHTTSNLQPATTLSTSQDDVLVRVEGVSKKFCRDLKKSLWYGVQDIASELNPFRSNGLQADGSTLQVPKEHNLQPALVRHSPKGDGGSCNSDEGGTNLQLATRNPQQNSPGLRPQEFYAVRDVSFELRRGECLGLIGRNGAGKTTLLKMLNGLIKPDSGKITMKGRIGALIALGAGFNPILTGRENVYVYGSVLGLTKKEIDAKFDEIVDFAEIGEFIDSPVRSYSSGMQVRLGFAVASALKPDILLVDEVLAVGDTAFRVRCYNRIRDILPDTAVIFVSHNMFDVARTCNRGVLLHKGVIAASSSTADIIRAYHDVNDQGILPDNEKLIIHRELDITDVQVNDWVHLEDGVESSLSCSLEFNSGRDRGQVVVRAVFFENDEIPVAEWDSRLHGKEFYLTSGKNRFHINIEAIRLKSGTYKIALVVADSNNAGYHVGVEKGLLLSINNDAIVGAPYKI